MDAADGVERLMEQLRPKHVWNPEARFFDEQLRARGVIALVDPEGENLFFWPVARVPKALLMQLSMNKKALGRQYCMDLLADACYNPPSEA